MGEIFIKNLEFDGKRVVNQISVSKDLEKFIMNHKMFVEYDEEIFANNSILNIPLTATMLPLAWLSGSDIQVSSIDKNFKESMDQIQSFFKKIYYRIPFKTEIKANTIVENQINVEDSESHTGLLFSGGVDATYSMLSNLKLKPRLIMHWGVERTPFPEYFDYWTMVVEKYSKIAKSYNLSFNFTKSNILEIIDPRRIEHFYYKELYYGSFWVRLQESLVLLSLTAPLSINRFDKLLIAASEWPTSIETRSQYRPHTANPEVDEKIRWASLEVKHDGFIKRLAKIKEITDYLNSDGELRVCLNRVDAPRDLNCNRCEKCGRTIVQLVQANVDPNICGFNVVDSYPFQLMKEYYTKIGLDTFALDSKGNIPVDLNYGFPGANEYFNWLKEYEVEEKEVNLFYRDIFNRLPYTLAKLVNEVYKVLGIEIFWGNPKLPHDKIKELFNHSPAPIEV